MAPPVPGHSTQGLARFLDTARVIVRRAAHAAVDLVMPPLCLSCYEPLTAHDGLCPVCWQGVTFIRPPLCDRLGHPMPYDTGGRMISAAAVAHPPVWGRARAVAQYDGVMRRLVHDFKYRDRHDARRLFGRWLAEAGAELVADADVIVPVPLARLRLLSRRFNQAAVLAGEVSRRTGVPFEPLALVRRRRTASQVGMTRRQRAENMRGAFEAATARRAAIRGRKVLLLDDVVTTGATAEACTRALLAAGAARVDVLALALVVERSLIVP
jgi:ComF family protein